MTELTKYNQWVLWKKDRKRGKVPFDAKTEKMASVSDCETWSSYSQAYRTYMENTKKYKGLGFVFTEEDPFVCIDLDHIDKEDSFIQNVLAEFSETYSETSQSGEGLHIICQGKKPGSKCRKKTVPNFEIYERNRFIAITGNSNGKEIISCQKAIDKVYNEVFGEELTTHHVSNGQLKMENGQLKMENGQLEMDNGQLKIENGKLKGEGGSGQLDDGKILELALKSKSGSNFGALYGGEDLHGDDSANDMALMNYLAFWTGKDPERMERLFSQSALGQRDKWQKREDYRRRTIQKACDDCDEVFEPKPQTDYKALAEEFYGDVSDHRSFNGKLKMENGQLKEVGCEQIPPTALASGPPSFCKEGQGEDWAVPYILKSFNDAGNSDYFCRMFQGKLIFSNDDWYEWNGTLWQRLTETEQYAVKVSEELTEIFRQIEDEGKFKARCLKWASDAGNKSRINAMVSLAQSDSRMMYKGDFDTKAYFIPCKNGVVNLKTGELNPHKKEAYWSKVCDCEYSSDPEIPVNFLKYMSDITCGNKDLEDYIQKVCGYVLCGHNREQVCFWLFGSGSTGKSTLLELIAKIMGGFATVFDASSFMEKGNNQFSLSELTGKRFIYTEEACGRKELDSAIFKAVTGGGNLQCQRKYKSALSVSFRQTVAMFGTNIMPGFTGEYAITRRLRFIPFKKQFKEEEKDIHLSDKLYNERDSIFSWMVYGAMKYLKEGLKEPEALIELKKEQVLESDPLAMWIDTHFEKDPEAFVSSQELWKRWLFYCNDTQTKNSFVNISVFFKKLKQVTGLEAKRIGTSRERVIVGIRFLDVIYNN